MVFENVYEGLHCSEGCIAVRVVFLFICGASGSNRLMAVVVYNMLLYVQC